MHLSPARVAALRRRNIVEIVGDVENAVFVDPAKVLGRAKLCGGIERSNDDEYAKASFHDRNLARLCNPRNSEFARKISPLHSR